MTEHFTIHKTREKLAQQWEYFLKRTSDRKIKSLKPFSRFAIVATCLDLLLIFLTKDDDFIVAKGVTIVLIAFCWVVVIILWLIFLVSEYLNKKGVRIYLQSISSQQLFYRLEINEDKIKIITGITFSEFLWEEYSSYAEYKDSIYIFNESQPLQSLYWSKDELGQEGYIFLKDLIQKKIPYISSI